MNPDGGLLFDHVRWLGLAARQFAVYGSGPLIVRGIVPATNDLDLISRGEVWDRAVELGDLVDATGAGDAFRAGYHAAIMRGKGPIDAMKFGNAMGALSTLWPEPQGYDASWEGLLELVEE